MSEVRLIDANALENAAIPCETHNGALTELCVPLYQIRNAPTVTPDMAQVLAYESGKASADRPTGYWKYNPDCVNDEMQSEFYCTNCNHGADSILSNYCPNCGAKMESGKWIINGINNLMGGKVVPDMLQGWKYQEAENEK